eukprot:scaffold177526_cov32-Tisochrysis_lutea.AAC.2
MSIGFTPTPWLADSPVRRQRGELQLRIDEMEDALEDRDRKIAELQMECGRLRVAGMQFGGHSLSRPTSRDTHLNEKGGEAVHFAKKIGVANLASSMGFSGSVHKSASVPGLHEWSASTSKRGNRRQSLPAPLGEDGDEFERFAQKARARKLALAARGFEVENVFIDQLFDDAKVLDHAAGHPCLQTNSCPCDVRQSRSA